MTAKENKESDTVISLHQVSHCCSEEMFCQLILIIFSFATLCLAVAYFHCVMACVILSNAIILPAFHVFHSCFHFKDSMQSISMEWTL